MTDQTWFIDLDLKLDSPVSDALLDDLLEAVEPLHGAVSPGIEFPTLGLSLAVEALDAWDASELARKFLEVDLGSIMPSLEICSLRILDEDTREAENEAPTFPELVTVPDVADILGVSRQQAHRLTKRQGFPTPALTPRTGDLWVRAAVEAWNERTERPKGRPRTKEQEADSAFVEHLAERVEMTADEELRTWKKANLQQLAIHFMEASLHSVDRKSSLRDKVNFQRVENALKNHEPTTHSSDGSYKIQASEEPKLIIDEAHTIRNSEDGKRLVENAARKNRTTGEGTAKKRPTTGIDAKHGS